MLFFNSKLATRVILGLGMIIALGGLLWGEGWGASGGCSCLCRLRGAGFAGLVSIFVILGCREYYHICRTKGYWPSFGVMACGAMLMVWQPFWKGAFGGGGEATLAGAVLAVILAAGTVQVARKQTDRAIGNMAVTGFGVIYLGFGGWFLMMIRLLGGQAGDAWGQIQYIVVFLACVKSSDIGAYITGRFLGRHKWVPAISPGKTWEGLAGGVVLAVIVASLFAGRSGIMTYGQAIIFGVVLALSGQLGDLVESLLKRDAGAKDSASRVPEFGGILDLIDSVVLAAPWAYFMFLL